MRRHRYSFGRSRGTGPVRAAADELVALATGFEPRDFGRSAKEGARSSAVRVYRRTLRSSASIAEVAPASRALPVVVARTAWSLKSSGMPSSQVLTRHRRHTRGTRRSAATPAASSSDARSSSTPPWFLTAAGQRLRGRRRAGGGAERDIRVPTIHRSTSAARGTRGAVASSRVMEEDSLDKPPGDPRAAEQGKLRRRPRAPPPPPRNGAGRRRRATARRRRASPPSRRPKGAGRGICEREAGAPATRRDERRDDRRRLRQKPRGSPSRTRRTTTNRRARRTRRPRRPVAYERRRDDDRRRDDRRYDDERRRDDDPAPRRPPPLERLRPGQGARPPCAPRRTTAAARAESFRRAPADDAMTSLGATRKPTAEPEPPKPSADADADDERSGDDAGRSPSR